MAAEPIRPIVTTIEPDPHEEPAEPAAPDPERALAEADADGPDLDEILPVADEVQEEVLLQQLAWQATPAGIAGIAIVAVVGLLRQARIVLIELILAVWHLVRRRPAGGAPRT